MKPAGPRVPPPIALASLALSLLVPGTCSVDAARVFRAGAAALDITPLQFPVIVNGMFTQREATNAHDRLHARALVLDDGATRIAIVVVDSCMMPRTLIDQAKDLVHQTTGIPLDRMLVSATHTHSAPSVMGCLGSDADTNYARFLPGKIAEAIEQASKNLAPARIGWAMTHDSEHTHCRRWIFQGQKVGTDPFGQPTVRANMHPGYQNPDAVGPAGPVDTGLSLLAVQTPDGRPIAVLANYSMHYYDSQPVSADYYGLFADDLARIVGATNRNQPFVGIMSQGTSGDQMWMDYGQPRHDPGLEAYADAIAHTAYAAYQQIQFHDWAPLVMAETKLTLGFRVPDETRLAWAERIVADLNGRLPRTQPEIYAREAIFLHDRPTAELKLQAIRIGDLGIAAIPNEVFGITGLKIKAQSPLAPTFNIELANGAEGYIPPPEQHKLGGYTTWPARTAGLETSAEPKIVETALTLLEQVSGKPRRRITETHGAYARAVLASKPVAYWRFTEFNGPTAFDSSGCNHLGTFEDGVAFYLPGPDAPGLSGPNAINRCVHLAGGRMDASIKGLGAAYSVELWFWNGLPNDARPVTGILFSRGRDGAKWVFSEHLGIGGPKEWGRLTLWVDGPWSRLEIFGRNEEVPLKEWNHVAFVRNHQEVAVYLNGGSTPELSGVAELPYEPDEPEVCIGGRSLPYDPFETFEGKIDEVAVYNRALKPTEITAHYVAASGRSRPNSKRP